MSATPPLPHRFGPNGALVDAVLEGVSLASVPGDDGMANLVASVCGVVADDTATPGASIRARIDHLIRDATDLDSRTVDALRLEITHRFGADLEEHVPAGDARDLARRLLVAAALWPAVHGAHPNPFAPGVELARVGVLVEIGQEKLHAWHRRLEVPVRLVCESTAVEGPFRPVLILPGD